MCLTLWKSTVGAQIGPSTIGPFAGTKLGIGGVSHALTQPCSWRTLDNRVPSEMMIMKQMSQNDNGLCLDASCYLHVGQNPTVVFTN